MHSEEKTRKCGEQIFFKWRCKREENCEWVWKAYFLQVMFIEINTLNLKCMLKCVISFSMGKRRNNLKEIRAKSSLLHIYFSSPIMLLYSKSSICIRSIDNNW